MDRDTCERYMRAALDLASLGIGSVSPNPRVGCVIADPASGRVIASGHHRKFGGPHAEVDALSAAGDLARGADVFVTLEPCSHTGKTPPCADALIRAGIGRAFIGTLDPNPLVAGRGASKLKDAGIEVSDGVLEDECRRMNRGFFSVIERGRPWITAKAAVSLDGAMAVSSGESKWITNSDSRLRAHILRAMNDAVLVGVGTIIADDPMLDVRDADGSSPIAVIVDPELASPIGSRVLSRAGTIVFARHGADECRAMELERRGVRVMYAETLGDIARELAGIGICYLLVEGGPRTISDLAREGLIDEMHIFTAPKLLGGGRKLGDTLRYGSMEDAIMMKDARSMDICGDVWTMGELLCSRVS